MNPTTRKSNSNEHLAVLGLLLLGVGFPSQVALANDNEAQMLESPKESPTVNFSQSVINSSSQLIAQNSQEANLEAYASSGYSYWDALTLSKWWNESLGDTKAHIGGKVSGGAVGKAILQQELMDGRIKALNNVNGTMVYYPETSYTYDDAVSLAKFWGDAGPSEAKTRIEKNLIMGNESIVQQALELSKKN
ncbi:MAG: hypothetical protein K8F91_21285 [Candidatus Obscuribacterales bacterium]|nr:hypothetical protein [Candidatus Obscuribacterales bacterium]